MRLRMVRAGFAMVPLVAVLSCAGQSAVGPGDVPTQYGPAPELAWTVSGVVRVHDGGGVLPATAGAVFGWWSSGGVKAAIDAEGRYQFTIPAKTNFVSVRDSAATQPCVALVQPTRDTIVDIDIVLDSGQIGARLPADLLSRQPLLSGVISEQTPNGPRPLSNVKIGLDFIDIDDGPRLAQTLTDEEGRYVFCAVPSPSTLPGLFLSAGLTGFRSASVIVTGKTTIDIELLRIP